MIYKLTIDINLLSTKPNSPAMQTLQRWKEEGKIELLEADPPKTQAYGWPGAPPKPPEPRSSWSHPKGRPKKMLSSGKATFATVASVLFPSKDPHKLNMGEINEVAHLIRHHSTGNEFFVTISPNFIDGGRRELLKAYFGIAAMTPEETVKKLTELGGWGENA